MNQKARVKKLKEDIQKLVFETAKELEVPIDGNFESIVLMQKDGHSEIIEIDVQINLKY